MNRKIFVILAIVALLALDLGGILWPPQIPQAVEMASSTISNLTDAGGVTTTDYFVIVDDTGGTPTTKRATASDVFSNALDAVFGSVETNGTLTFANDETIGNSVNGELLATTDNFNVTGSSHTRIEALGGTNMNPGFEMTNDAARWLIFVNGNADDEFSIGEAVSSTFPLKIEKGSPNNVLIIEDTGDVKIGGGGAATAQMHIDQSSVSGAQPVLTLDQGDQSEELLRLIGTAASGVKTNSVVNVTDVTTATIVGYVEVYVQDDGNQITDGSYYVPFYSLQ